PVAQGRPADRAVGDDRAVRRERRPRAVRADLRRRVRGTSPLLRTGRGGGDLPRARAVHAGRAHGRHDERRRDCGPGRPAARPRGVAMNPRETRDDRAFTWLLVFTLVLFLRPQDLIPPLQVLHLAEISAVAGLLSLFAGRLRRGAPLTRITVEFTAVLALGAVILF